MMMIFLSLNISYNKYFIIFALLPCKLEQKMAILGEQIKLARLRRNLSMAQVAGRATCSPLTIYRIEKGAPTVSIGIYARVWYCSLTTIFYCWQKKIPLDVRYRI